MQIFGFTFPSCTSCTVLVLLTAAVKIQHQSHSRSTSAEGRLLQRSCIHLKGHITSVKDKIPDTERASKFYSASARQSLHRPRRSPGKRGRRAVSFPTSTELIFWRCQAPRVSTTKPLGSVPASLFFLASLGEERPGLWVLAVAALRGCGLWAPCPAAPRQRAARAAWGNSGHRIWAAQAARAAPGESRSGRRESPAPRLGTAAIRARGRGTGRLCTGRGAGSAQGPAVGPAEGSGPAGRIPREQVGLRAERQKGGTRGKSRGSEPAEAQCAGVWAVMACRAGERTGQGQGQEDQSSLPRECSQCSRRVTTGTAAGQTPPCRNSGISQAASNSKSCLNKSKEAQVQLLMHQLIL